MLDAVSVALSQNSDEQDLSHMVYADVTATITANNPSDKTFEAADVTAGDDTVAIAEHGYLTGVLCQLTTTGTLPAGLSTASDFYIITVSSGVLAFAASQADALAGTKIDITDGGTGTHTIDITTTLAGTVKLQKNNEPDTLDAVWFDVASSSQNITAAGNLNWELTDIGYRSLRAVVTVTSGTVLADVRINAKGA